MRARAAIPVLLALLAAAFLASLAFGEMRLSFGQVLAALQGGGDEIARTVVRDFRLPRALVGMAVGAALGASGVVMQAFFRNPLASPGLLGVSSGGALGAVAVLAMGPVLGFASATLWALPLASVAGAFAATGAVLMLAQRGAGTERLLLSGVALNALLGAGTSFLLTTTAGHFEVNAQILFWLMGGLESRSWEHVWMGGPPILAACLLLLPLGRPPLHQSLPACPRLPGSATPAPERFELPSSVCVNFDSLYFLILLIIALIWAIIMIRWAR